MQRRPIYQFNADTETGVDKLPIGSLVSVGVTSPKHYTLDNKTGVTAATTIAQAVTANNLKAIGGGSSLTSYTFTATEGQTKFVTTGTALSATPLVFLNGALQQITATYTVAGLTVTFLDARVAGDSIVIVG